MISIIVPCYNGMNYIVRNIESLLNQVDKEFEVIYVDDGSSDGSEVFLQKYSEKYDFISIISIPNSGAMKARQTGLATAKYDYVTFVDVDDTIDPSFIYDFKQQICSHKFDIIGSNFKIQIDKKTSYLNSFTPGTYTNETFLEKLCTNGGWELCGKVYLKKLFNNVNYPDKVVIGEDALIFFQLVTFAKKIKIIDSYLYNYIQHVASVSHIKSLKMCADGLKAAFYIRNFLQLNSTIEKKYLDSLVLLFFSNSLRRGLLKRSHEFYPEIKQALNLSALSLLSTKKKITALVGFILMGLNF